MKVWIKDPGFPAAVFKQVFKNKERTEGIRFPASNGLDLTNDRFKAPCKKRRDMEEYHKSLKQNASTGSSPAYNERERGKHIFAAVFGYGKPEMMKISPGINRFEIKAKIYPASTQTAMTVFQSLWENTKFLAFA